MFFFEEDLFVCFFLYMNRFVVRGGYEEVICVGDGKGLDFFVVVVDMLDLFEFIFVLVFYCVVFGCGKEVMFVVV